VKPGQIIRHKTWSDKHRLVICIGSDDSDMSTLQVRYPDGTIGYLTRAYVSRHYDAIADENEVFKLKLMYFS
jgi:hypothetical protein